MLPPNLRLSVAVILVFALGLSTASADTMLVDGQPPLTQAMANRANDFSESILAVRMTGPQRQQMQPSLVASWQLEPPPPLKTSTVPPPPGDTAAVLAKQVRAGGAGALPALRMALRQAGFSVLGPEGNVELKPTGPSQGLAFASWEVEGMVSLEGREFGVSLADIGAALAAGIPELEGQPVGALLLDGIRQQAQSQQSAFLLWPPFQARSQQPALRFWARFIVELGRLAPEPYDLLGDIDPATVQLDAVQTGLVLRRLVGDLWAMGLRARAVGSASGAPGGQEGALAAAWPPGGSGDAPMTALSVAALPSQSLPCTLSDTESMILDGFSVVTSGVWVGIGALLPNVGVDGYSAESAVDGYSKWTGRASLVLAYAKLIVMMMAFESEVTMGDPGPPLVRTTEAWPKSGEMRNLRAKVWMDLGNAQIVNCVRPALNVLGLDFDLPNDGAIADAEVNWILYDGGEERHRGGEAGIVRWAEGTRPDNTPTSEEGISRISIEGMPQPEELPGKVVPWMKRACVRAAVQVEGANMLKDLMDAAGTALGGGTGLLASPVEMLLRTRWLFGKDYCFAVKDWEPAGRWSGTITYNYLYTRENAQSNPGGSESSSARYNGSRQEEIQINVGHDTSASDALLRATVNGTYQISQASESHRTSPMHCPGSGAGSTFKPAFELVRTQSSVIIQDTFGTRTQDVEGSFHLSRNGSYSLSFKLGEIPWTSNKTEILSDTGWCDPRNDVNTSRGTTTSGEMNGIRVTIDGTVDPQSDTPNVLTGTKTTTSPIGGYTTTVTWNIIAP